MPHLCILSFLSWQSSWAASAHHLSWNVGFLLPTYSLIKVLLKLCFTNLCLSHFFSKEKKIWRGKVYKANNRYKNIHTIHILTVTSLLHLTLLSKAKSLKRAQTLYFWVDFFLLWLKLEYYYPRIINTWKSNQKTVKLQLCLLGRAGGSSLISIWRAWVSELPWAHVGALCSVSFFLHLSVLQLGRDWWPLRREVTPRLMCSHCKEKENAKQGPRTWLWSWSLDAESCCEQDFVGRLSGSAVFLLLFSFSPGCCIKYFPPGPGRDPELQQGSGIRVLSQGACAGQPAELCHPRAQLKTPSPLRAEHLSRREICSSQMTAPEGLTSLNLC